MERKRCFISIDLPELIRKEIEKIQEKLPEFRGKKIELENIHLTLKFLGEITDREIELAREALRSVQEKRFKIKISKIGVFSEKFIRIVWLGVEDKDEESKKLWRLQGDIDDKLKDLFEKERRFMGHITIARIKNLKDKKKFLEQLEKIKANLEFEVKDFRLKESILREEGPEYRVIETYTLS